MIKQKFIIGLFFKIILTSGYAQEPVNKLDKNQKRHGIWQKYFKGTNQLRYTGKFYHGKEIDTFKYYKLKNGKSVLSAIKVFNKNNDIANVIFLASNKKKISEGQMNGHNFIGHWSYYHKNSDRIMTKEHYNKNGNLEGERVIYFKNGKIAELSNYKNGKRIGLATWYAENGNIQQESDYNNDKLNGKTKYYDASGKLRSEGYYKDNIKIGEWSYYNKSVLVKKVDHDTDTVLFAKN